MSDLLSDLLAELITRPQSEYQIGAGKDKLYVISQGALKLRLNGVVGAQVPVSLFGAPVPVSLWQ
ncbi:MAG: hypothetical protein HYR92_02415 [Burkholderiales bacterium]|nr:hypothetical protein [Burkholderiales bacterium]